MRLLIIGLGHRYYQVKNFTNAEATTLQGGQIQLVCFLENNAHASPHTATNPDFATQDLFEAIQNKECPGWIVYAQVLTPAQAEKFKYNVLDLTKFVSKLLCHLQGMLTVFSETGDSMMSTRLR